MTKKSVGRLATLGLFLGVSIGAGTRALYAQGSSWDYLFPRTYGINDLSGIGGGTCGKCDPAGACIAFNTNIKCVEGPTGCTRKTDLCQVIGIF